MPDAPSNLPGLTALAYRVSDYSSAKRRLIDHLYTPILPNGLSLAALKTRDLDDTAIALIDAWAIVLDVLTFYQERIANEGYWRTAIERESLVRLARTIGCELKPGVAASTYLMFTLEETPSAPKVVTLPKNTQVLSVPDQDALPQTFETSQELVAQADWNAIQPRASRPQILTNLTHELLLKGLNTQLQSGDRVLLIDQPGDGEVPQGRYVLHLTRVDVIAGQTRITWKPQQPLLIPPRNPRLFAFRQRAALFGNRAPKWDSLPTEIKRDYSEIKGGVFRFTGATSIALSQGLPSLDIRCLGVNPISQDVFAGTAGGGVWRRHEQRWISVNVGLTNLTIESLYCNADGLLLAGSPTGGLFRSKDNGETWTPIGLGSVRVEEVKSGDQTRWVSVTTGLPNTVVRALLTYTLTAENSPQKEITLIFAGTEDGIYCSQDQGKNWDAQKSLPSSRVVTALLAIDTGEPESYQTQSSQTEELAPKAEESERSSRLSNASSSTLIATPIAPTLVQNFTPHQPNLDAAQLVPAQLAIVMPPQPIQLVEQRADTIVPPSVQKTNPFLSRFAFLGKAIRRLLPKTQNRVIVDTTRIAPSNSSQGISKTAITNNINSNTNGNKISGFDVFQLNSNSIQQENEISIPLSLNGNGSAKNANQSTVNETSANAAPNLPSASKLSISSSDRLSEPAMAVSKTEGNPNPMPLPCYLFAGTDKGIYRSQNHIDDWHLVSDSEDFKNAYVTSLACLKLVDRESYTLFAGTREQGVLRSTDHGDSWDEFNIGLDKTLGITALSIMGDTLYAGTVSGKVLQSRCNQESSNWTGVEAIQIDGTEITTLANRLDRELWLGTRFVEVTQTDWSRSGQKVPLEPQSIDEFSINLDSVYAKIFAESWVVLIDERTSQAQAYPVIEVSSQLVSGFTLEAPVTHIKTQPQQIPLSEFLPQTTIVLAQSEPLELAEIALTVQSQQQQILNDPIEGDRIFLSQFVSGLQSGQQLLVKGQRLRVKIQQVGGVWQSTRSDLWQRANQGLTNQTIRALAIDPQKNLFAGTANGLFRLKRNTKTWETLNDGLTHSSIQAFAIWSNELFVGTANGVFRFDPTHDRWLSISQGLVDRDITVLVADQTSDETRILLAGTQGSGLFRWIDEVVGWQALNRDLTDSHIQAIVINQSGSWFVGTASSGIFRSHDQGNRWQQVGYANKPGSGAIVSEDQIVIGTGTYFRELKPRDQITADEQTATIASIESDTRLTVEPAFLPPGLPDGTPFTLSTGLTNPNVTTLLAYDRTIGATSSLHYLFAGTKGSGVFRSSDNGDHWEPIPARLTNLNITLLVDYPRTGKGAISSDETTIVGVGSRFTQDLQVGALITANAETRQVIAILSDEVLVINDEFTSVLTNHLYSVDTLVAATDNARVFCSIDQGNSWNTGIFYCNNSEDSEPEFANTAIRTIVSDANTLWVGGVGILPTLDRLSQVELQLGDRLQVMTPPQNSSQQWHLIDANGVEGLFTTQHPDEDLLLESAEVGDEYVSELASILSAPSEQKQPILRLRSPLQNQYDPATVTLHANIVEATHGETIPDTIEVLGGGDGNLANQQFVLKKPPLTYVSAPDAEGVISTLQIRVNDLLWQQVSALHNLNPDDPVYQVRIEEDGSTIVTFGDGINGSRLPSGIENVVATYRSGIGLTGNLRSDRLTLLKTRPLGLQAVTNPVPATGAADRETAEQARSRAPLTVRTLQRVVSRRDFEDFTRTFAGIGKVMAIALWTSQAPVVHITIAASDGDEIRSDSALYTNLVSTIEAVRDPFQPPPVIASYERIWFALSATVLVNSRYSLDLVQADVETRLKAAFAFDQRTFGQAVTAAEAIAVIQSTTGVIAVDLDLLYRLDAPRSLEQSLLAALAVWDEVNQQFYPAQMVLLHHVELTFKPLFTS